METDREIIAVLCDALTDAVKRLRMASIMAGSDEEFVDIMLEQYRAALALARGEHPAVEEA